MALGDHRTIVKKRPKKYRAGNYRNFTFFPPQKWGEQRTDLKLLKWSKDTAEIEQNMHHSEIPWLLEAPLIMIIQ